MVWHNPSTFPRTEVSSASKVSGLQPRVTVQFSLDVQHHCSVQSRRPASLDVQHHCPNPSWFIDFSISAPSKPYAFMPASVAAYLLHAQRTGSSSNGRVSRHLPACTVATRLPRYRWCAQQWARKQASAVHALKARDRMNPVSLKVTKFSNKSFCP